MIFEKAPDPGTPHFITFLSSQGDIWECGKRGRIRAPSPVSVEQDVGRSLMEGDIRFLLISVGLTFYPGEGNGTPLQYSCLENPMDGGAS